MADPRTDPAPTAVHDALVSLGLGGCERIGSGAGCWVFAVDADRVIKVYRNGNAPAIEVSRQFFAWLASQALPFRTPEIQGSGEAGGLLYTIEARMPGVRFADLLPRLRGSDRRRVLDNYFRAGKALAGATPPGEGFGQLVRAEPIVSTAWQGFLRRIAEREVADALPDLRDDLRDADAAVAAAWRLVERIGEPPSRSLVHGDFWPDNVMIGDNLEVAAVLDWEWLTVAGDHRLDLASISFFMESAPGYLPEDVTYLENLAIEHVGPAMRQVIDAYRAWFALAFAHCKREDTATYAWSVANLRRLALR